MEKDQGSIIRLTKLTETSLIVHWCTEENGVIKTVAKGARRAKSSFAGQLDLFVEAELVWQSARSGELHALKELSVKNYREGLRKSYAQTVTAAYFCALLENVVEPMTPVPEFTDLLKRGLDYLAKEKASRRAVDHYEKQMAQLLGVAGSISAIAAIERHGTTIPRSRQTCLEYLE